MAASAIGWAIIMLPIEIRLQELMLPIERQIMMCNDTSEMILLCFGMMNKAKLILDAQWGEEKRKELFREHT
jgi:hypothetical protein